MNHEITIKTEKIKSSLLISIRSEKQEIVKEYLDEMTKKRWIRISKSFMTASLFLIFKPEINKKRLIIDYRKLNKEIVTDSTSLLLIKNIMNQIKRQKYFIKIDLKNTFNQIRIKERNK